MIGNVILKVFGLLAATWLMAATVDLWPRDQIRVFGMSRKIDPSTDQLTTWRVEAPHTYRVEGQTILRKVGGLVSRFDDCVVFGLKNWKCSYSDGSGWFTMVDGVYVESPMNSDLFPGYEWTTVSEFRYHMERCKRWVHSNLAEGIFGCAISPFID